MKEVCFDMESCSPVNSCHRIDTIILPLHVCGGEVTVLLTASSKSGVWGWGCVKYSLIMLDDLNVAVCIV